MRMIRLHNLKLLLDMHKFLRDGDECEGELARSILENVREGGQQDAGGSAGSSGETKQLQLVQPPTILLDKGDSSPKASHLISNAFAFN
ncbi:unnamed protein product, partial [Amoebophrya sp. A25]|eukprot:GSA25T00012612001.1